MCSDHLIFDGHVHHDGALNVDVTEFKMTLPLKLTEVRRASWSTTLSVAEFVLASLA